VANYETLIRRLINRAPAAAFLSVAAFRFVANEAPLLDANGNTTGANLTLPNPFYGSGLLLGAHITVCMSAVIGDSSIVRVRRLMNMIVYDTISLLVSESILAEAGSTWLGKHCASSMSMV
jgi:hypothetical protein